MFPISWEPLSPSHLGTAENVCDKISTFMNIFLLATGTDRLSGKDFFFFLSLFLSFLHFFSLAERTGSQKL